MKLQLITIGSPKLDYAKRGVTEYTERLKHYHQCKIIHIADKHNDSAHILAATGTSYTVALEIDGIALSSQGLAQFLDKRALDGREVSFIIGGPDGLPDSVLNTADFKWSLGSHTMPHDLAMLVTLEALYRASTIQAGHPYHRQ